MHRDEFLRNLIIMAVADNSLAQSEIQFLSDRCHRFGIEEADFSALIQQALAQRENAKISIPDTKEERVFLIQELIRAMAADGFLDPGEKRLFAVAAGRMEIGEDELNQIIDEVLADGAEG